MQRFEWRNHGCRGLLVKLRGYQTLILENETLRTSWLVDRGTDVIEFLYKPLDVDFLYRSRPGILSHAAFQTNVQLKSGNYMDIYEGGWQEILPSCTADSYKGAQFGAFGEACLLPWDWDVVTDCASKVTVRSVGD